MNNTTAEGAMDYKQIIDAETWAFIDKTLAHYPADAATWSVQKNREVYDDMSRVFASQRPVGVNTEDRHVAHIPVRVYETGEHDITIVYFHGGGFILGGLDSHDGVCAELCARTGYRVVSVDYRLAPEHKHPAAFDDSYQATMWAADEWQQPIVLAGDSAGGNLAAAVAHAIRGKDAAIVGQVLIYPGLGGNVDEGSYITYANAPLLTRDEVLYYTDVRYDGGRPVADVAASPLDDSDFTGLPATVIVSAQCDPLSDDGRHYRDKIHAAGGKAVWFNEDGLVHGYLRARHSVERARASFTRIVEAARALGSGVWPYA
ncbi:MAG: alpha/beta hydrolase [Hyphomicrobiales bacterium]|nr:alpha/beta hydrolase [Hyphomicrobiales bacterium]